MNLTPTASTAQTIRQLGDSVIRLADALAQAESVQHERPAAPSVRETDPSRRASGTVSNPTHDTATDSRRLRLRAAVVSGELAASELSAKAHQAATELETALQRWAGSRW